MNPIVTGIGKKALDLFYKKFGRRIIKTAADSKWMANTIRLLKQKAHKPKTSDIAQKVREGLRKDRPFQGFKPPIVPKQFNKFRPRVIQGGKSKKPIPAEDIIKKGDWDPSGFKSGGRIDKALPTRSRDI
jgi:hypothetical protein